MNSKNLELFICYSTSIYNATLRYKHGSIRTVLTDVNFYLEEKIAIVQINPVNRKHPQPKNWNCIKMATQIQI